MLPAVIGAFAGGIGLAVAFGLWSLLPGKWQGARTSVSIVAAVLVGLAASQVRLPARTTDPRQIEQLVTASELTGAVSALRQTDPATLERLMRSANLLAERGDHDAALARVRSGLISAARDRYARLDDDFNMDRFRLTHDELLELADVDASLCWPIVHGRVTAILEFPLSGELRHREVEMLERALQSPLEPAAPLDPDAFQTTMSNVYESLHSTFGPDADLIQGSPSANEERPYCEVAAEYYQLLARVPEPARVLATAQSRTSPAEASDTDH